MSICDDCPLRLYNKKSHNLKGVGNPYYGNLIVVPNVDYNAYKNESMSFSKQVKIIEDILSFSTGVVDSNLFIVPLIRCNEGISCKVDKATYDRCLIYLANDIKKYNFTNILLLGNAARTFLNVNINEHLNDIFISSNKRKYVVNYSPFIKYHNDELYDLFKDKLLKWYNSINDGFYEYNMKLI